MRTINEFGKTLRRRSSCCKLSRTILTCCADWRFTSAAMQLVPALRTCRMTCLSFFTSGSCSPERIEDRRCLGGVLLGRDGGFGLYCFPWALGAVDDGTIPVFNAIVLVRFADGA